MPPSDSPSPKPTLSKLLAPAFPPLYSGMAAVRLFFLHRPRSRPKHGEQQRKMEKIVWSIPAVRARVHAAAQPKWDTGVTATMREGNADVIRALTDVLVALSEFFPQDFFQADGSPRAYYGRRIDDIAKWHWFRHEPDGPGTGGTIVHVLTGADVMAALDAMVEEMVEGLIGLGDSAYDEWGQLWKNSDPRWDVRDHMDDADEDLGSKKKHWLTAPDGRLLLFKEGRGSAENWAEVAASEICGRLGIPYAPYALATRGDRQGVVSPDFCAPGIVGRGRQKLFFSHASDELRKVIPNYDASRKRQPREYTVAACVDLLRRFDAEELPIGSLQNTPRISRLGFFIGYLMLDALIGNNDRHHENWGFLRDGGRDGKVLSLAPTFDHASGFCKNSDKSMGERLRNQEIVDRVPVSGERMTAAMRRKLQRIKDDGLHVEGFCRSRKPRPAFYGENCTPMEAFSEAARTHPEARKKWLSRLEKMDVRRDLGPFFANACHYGILTEVAAIFSLRMLEINRKRLLTETNQ